MGTSTTRFADATRNEICDDGALNGQPGRLQRRLQVERSVRQRPARQRRGLRLLHRRRSRRRRGRRRDGRRVRRRRRDRDASDAGDDGADVGAGAQRCSLGISESRVCNSDCTTARCGDRKINQAAGEQCDDGGESKACNVDCTFASCGDGKVNRTANEECDVLGGADTPNCNGTAGASRTPPVTSRSAATATSTPPRVRPATCWAAPTRGLQRRGRAAGRRLPHRGLRRRLRRRGGGRDLRHPRRRRHHGLQWQERARRRGLPRGDLRRRLHEPGRGRDLRHPRWRRHERLQRNRRRRSACGAPWSSAATATSTATAGETCEVAPDGARHRQLQRRRRGRGPLPEGQVRRRLHQHRRGRGLRRRRWRRHRHLQRDGCFRGRAAMPARQLRRRLHQRRRGRDLRRRRWRRLRPAATAPPRGLALQCKKPSCGDGYLNTSASEACDDKNKASGDGCSSPACQIETGFVCPTPGQPCHSTCGDGQTLGSEAVRRLQRQRVRDVQCDVHPGAAGYPGDRHDHGGAGVEHDQRRDLHALGRRSRAGHVRVQRQYAHGFDSRSDHERLQHHRTRWRRRSLRPSTESAPDWRSMRRSTARTRARCCSRTAIRARRGSWTPRRSSETSRSAR